MAKKKTVSRPENVTVKKSVSCINAQANDCKSLTIIEALDSIQEKAHDSKLGPTFRKECRREFDFLHSRLDLSDDESILLAVLCEMGEAVTWRTIGKFLGMSRLKVMCLTPAFDALLERRWLYCCGVHQHDGRYQGFKLTYGILNAFRHNHTFVPEKIDGLTEQAFVDRLTRYVSNEGEDNDIPIEENHRWMLQLVDVNRHLPLCKKVGELENTVSKIILLLEVTDYARCYGDDNEGLFMGQICGWFDNNWELDSLADELQRGSQELFIKGLIEHGIQDDGMVDTERFMLTKDAKEQLLSGFKHHRRRRHLPMALERIMRKAAEIEEKALYFNSDERVQLQRLESLLCGDCLQEVQQRLAEGGMRKGIACLFYGTPGTGKTESVLQLARRSGRDIMQIDIAGLRDKYVGESEKNIKQVFSRYRDLCENSKRTPILLFNEADAIINSRFETTRSSVEKMDNAMQNIILQEMEDLDGIMIATTNLTGTLDKAFDRRFLFKVSFSRPDARTRSEIWHSMMPGLSTGDCHELASEFDFSGGQIENISRKCKIEYVITGRHPDLPQIREFCSQERLNRENRNRIGF